MVYPGPTDPYFLAVILVPDPHFPENFLNADKNIDTIHVFTKNFNFDNFVYLQV